MRVNVALIWEFFFKLEKYGLSGRGTENTRITIVGKWDFYVHFPLLVFVVPRK